MRNFLPLIVLLVSFNGIASDDFQWKLANGDKAPETENQKSVKGFGGWLLVTPDKDWEEKWLTPRENVPYFNEAKDVKLGQELTILPFFANPKLDSERNFNVLCDIKVEKPDGTFSINETDVPCAQGKLDMDPMSIFLTQTVIKYTGENGDPFGQWVVYFEIKDLIRGVSVPLKTSFNLVK
jgi:hypothetical protein